MKIWFILFEIWDFFFGLLEELLFLLFVVWLVFEMLYFGLSCKFIFGIGILWWVKFFIDCFKLVGFVLVRKKLMGNEVGLVVKNWLGLFI